MVEITDIAASWMRSALLERGENSQQCFRMIVTGRGVQLMRGEKRPDDLVAYSHEGRVVLVLDPSTADFLKDYGLDCDADKSGLVVAAINSP